MLEKVIKIGALRPKSKITFIKIKRPLDQKSERDSKERCKFSGLYNVRFEQAIAFFQHRGDKIDQKSVMQKLNQKELEIHNQSSSEHVL